MDFVAAQYAALACQEWFEHLVGRLTVQGVVDRVAEMGEPRVLHIDDCERYMEGVRRLIEQTPPDLW